MGICLVVMLVGCFGCIMVGMGCLFWVVGCWCGVALICGLVVYCRVLVGFGFVVIGWLLTTLCVTVLVWVVLGVDYGLLALF